MFLLGKEGLTLRNGGPMDCVLWGIRLFFWIMNYVSTDAYRIGEFLFWFHQTWTTCLQLCLALIILFRAVGLATIASLVVIILTVLCNAPLAKLQHKFQSKLMVAQDDRLKATSEALVNMKTLRLVQEPVRCIPDVIGVVIQAKVAFARIVKFLEAPELENTNIRQKRNMGMKSHSIFINSASFLWEESPLKPTLRNINLEVRDGEKVAICGEVGSGKSTLLAAILGEVPNIQGTLMSDGEILQAAPYHQLLASSREFQDLVNAHKETGGAERLEEVSSSQKCETSIKEIRKTHTEEKSEGDQLIKQEEGEVGGISLKPYMQYLNQNKGYLLFSTAFICHLTFVIGSILQNSWMAANVENPNVTTLRLSLSIVALGTQSSKSLFSQLLNSLFRVPMSFYDSTPLGRILSWVSADLSIVDPDVPFSFVYSFSSTINTYANLVVLAVVTWQRYYFSAAKELMRINGTTKSSVANHLAESIAGLMTIRAFGEQERFFVKNLDLIDINASPFFHCFAANEWLIERLGVLSAVVLSSSALCMVLLPPGTFSSGFVGMALSYGLSLNMSLVFSIQNQCTLANLIISVERLNQYMHIPSEAPEVIEANRPPANWPIVGKVEIQDLKIRYRPDAPIILRGITCTFEGGHKIGIVGRTGSGKSTLIGALFRLVEPAGGKIVIDEIDISTFGLHDLRSQFGIIPQDPTLFNGTGRYNLDPLGQHNDQEIWEFLENANLERLFRRKKRAWTRWDGSNSSMGQRQLFCLGRALLRRSKILVLDEVTASIDNATDLILQRTIRIEFADCTVITVVHRIPTVMDSTMVLAISDGKLVEYDEPLKLMK
ncbi:unnamed protein product [Camellia sinensis]